MTFQVPGKGSESLVLILIDCPASSFDSHPSVVHRLSGSPIGWRATRSIPESASIHSFIAPRIAWEELGITLLSCRL